MKFKTISGKLYLIQLENWEAFIKVMDDDFNKKKEFRFFHPLDGKIAHYRHYVYFPAIGNTFMMVGRLRYPTDSACVRIVHDSENYKVSYLVIYDYLRCFDDADLMAKMLENAFNEALKDEGVKMKLVPWDTKGKTIMWIADSETTYNIHYHESQGINVSKYGYEDLREHYKKVNARNKKRKEAKVANEGPKKEKVVEFIKDSYQAETIMSFLRDTLNNCRTPKMIGLTFRLLRDRKIMAPIPFNIIMKQMPELMGSISKSRYNYWVYEAPSKCSRDKYYVMTSSDLDKIL